MKKEDKEYVISMRIMGSIIENFLKGKLETEITDLLKINLNEVRYVLGEGCKTCIINTFGAHVWEAIKQQKLHNQEVLKGAYKEDFLFMSGEELRYIINSIISTCEGINEYCETYNLNQTLLLLHLLDQDYLTSKLGRVRGMELSRKIYCNLKEKIPFKKKQAEFFHLCVLYLDSIYTTEEFIKNFQIDCNDWNDFLTNRECFQQLGNEDLFDILRNHKKQIENIRRRGNLPNGQYWLKDAHFRRILKKDVNHTTPKGISDLRILLSYYENKGNIEHIKREQKVSEKRITKVIQSLDQYAMILQPYVLQKISLLIEAQQHHLVTSIECYEKSSVVETINYKKEVEQKIEWLEALSAVGNIRPYWLCGQLAIHNFSYSETALDLGVDETEIALSNYSCMFTLCRTSQGLIFPFVYSYEVLKYASTIYHKEQQKYLK